MTSFNSHTPGDCAFNPGAQLEWNKRNRKIYLFAIDFYVCYVVFEYSGYIYFGELVFAEDNEETGFTTSTISNDHKLLADCRHGHLLNTWKYINVCQSNHIFINATKKITSRIQIRDMYIAQHMYQYTIILIGHSFKMHIGPKNRNRQYTMRKFVCLSVGV